MERALRWKSVFLLLLVAASVASLLPSVTGERFAFFTKKVKLGLDLEGGLHLVYRVDLDKVIDDKAGELRRDIEAKLGEQKVQAKVETPRSNPTAGVPLGAVFISPEGGGTGFDKVNSKFLDDYEESLIKMDCPADRKNAICLRVAPDYAEKIKGSALEQAKKIITERVDRSGVADPTIVKKGDDIVVELPGTDDEENERLRSIINRTAQLEFKIVDDGTPFMQKLGSHVQADEKARERRIRVDSDSWSSEQSETQHSDYSLI